MYYLKTKSRSFLRPPGWKNQLPKHGCLPELFFQKHPPELFYKKGVLNNFAKFTGRHLWQSLFFKKVTGLRPASLLIQKKIWHRCFPVNSAKFSRPLFLQNTVGRLLLFFVFTTAKLYLRWNCQLLEVFLKTAFLKISANSQKNTCSGVSF